MEKDFEDLKEEYDNIPIPKNLNEVIDKSIIDYRREEIKMKNRKLFKTIIAASLLIISSFTIGVNTSESFATTAGKIPGVSIIIKLVSFNSFIIEDEVVNAEVNIPAVEGFESKTLEEQINKEIQSKMNTHLEAGQLKAKANKKAFLETGGKTEDFRPMIIKIDYSIKSYNDNRISFAVYYYESMASSYSETYYYTIDLKEDKLLTIEDLLGSNYEDKINEQITDRIEKELEESPSKYFEGAMGFNGITKNQNFYIDDDNQIVIVFDKYEIAPGSSGEPEFIIED